MLSSDLERPVVGTARAAADLFGPLLAGEPIERLLVAYLDGRRGLIALEQQAGLADEAALPVRAILAKALRIGARGLILAHNHPSGDPTPSAADKAATRLLADAAAGLGIPLHDHLVFGDGKISSFRALGPL